MTTNRKNRILAALAVAVLPLLMTSVPAHGAQAAALPPGGPTKLVNRNSSKCADVEGWSKDDGGNVHQWSCRLDNDSNQKWTFRRTADGYWNVVNQNSGKCLDIQGPSYADGAHLHQWTCSGYGSQKWELQYTTTEYFKLVSAYSGKCADVEGPSLNDGAQIHQWTCRNQDDNSQQWRFFTAT
ncbi:RICIN domain-containing protein [Streptomyces sp. NPDC127051]|uniref:RICIN domain-containing protein n=1 Tax=Streptomyces sp. NPDC127051 TaxID=3347119 RepID=UPI00365C23A9